MFSNQIIKPCLIVLSSKPSANIYKVNDKGVKLSCLIQVKKMFNLQNVEWEIATIGGKKALINMEGDESNKDWIKDNQEKFANPLILEKINPKNFSGLLFLNIFGFYTDFYSLKKSNENIKLKDFFSNNIISGFDLILKDFLVNNKPIACIGYGLIPLFQIFEKEEWCFKKFNMTGISINEECREIYFSVLPFLIEESVREMEGYFCSEENINQQFVIVDKNLITGQNDTSLLCVINQLAFLISKSSLFNI